MILTKSKPSPTAATSPKSAGAKTANPAPSPSNGATNAGSAAASAPSKAGGASPADVATALALERAREVLRNGGTKEEATAAAKEVARTILQKQQQAQAATQQRQRVGGAGVTAASPRGKMGMKRRGQGLPPASPAGANRTGFMSKFRKKKAKSKSSPGGTASKGTAAGLTVERAGRARTPSPSPAAARDDVESTVSKASDRRDTIAPASDKAEKDTKGGVFKRTRSLGVRKGKNDRAGNSVSSNNSSTGSGTVGKKGTKAAAKSKGGKSAKAAASAKTTPLRAPTADSWATSGSYTTSGEYSESYSYHENEAGTFVSQDVSVYEGGIPSVFIGSNPSQDVSVLGGDGGLAEGDPWAKRVGIDALAVDLLSLENIMDVVDKAIYPETKEEKAKKAAEANKRAKEEKAKEEKRAAKKAAEDEANIREQLVRVDSGADRSLDESAGCWLTRAFCCGPVCGPSFCGSNSLETNSLTMVSQRALCVFGHFSIPRDMCQLNFHHPFPRIVSTHRGRRSQPPTTPPTTRPTAPCRAPSARAGTTRRPPPRTTRRSRPSTTTATRA